MRRLVPLLLSIVFIGLGIFVLVRGNALAKRCTVDVVGTVVDITREETTDSDGFTEHTYYPIIEYQAGDEKVTVKGTNGSNPSKYQEGDKIDLLYNPDNVKEYIEKGDNSSNIIGIILIVVGILVFFMGIKTLLLGR